MAKAARSTLPPVVDPTDEDDYGDELTEAEARQAEVGTLFTIQGPEFEDVSWSIHRYRTKHEIALDPNGKPEAWVADISGELKGSELVDLLGGGTFHFYGHVPKANGGVKIKYNKIVTLEGPRKNFSESHDVVTPTATNGMTMSAAEVELVRLRGQLRRERREREKAEAKREIDDRFTRMESLIERAMARPEPPPPPRDKLSDLIGAVVSLKQLDGNGTGQSEAMKMVFDSFRQGLELGTTREPVPMDGTDPNPTWIPAALGVLEKFLATMAARRPVPGGAPRPATTGAPPPPPPPRSEATVVDTPEPAPNAPIADEVPPQWRTACASLFRAMTNGIDPRDFASSLRDMLNPDEVKSLLHASADDVLGYMRGLNLLTQYPALETEQGKVYLTDVLAGLRANEEESTAAQ